MSTTSTSISNANSVPPQNSAGFGLKEMMASGALYRHATGLLALAGVITLGIGLIMWASKPTFVPVYDRINNHDAQSMAETLRADHIPFQIDNNSGLILVPAGQVQQARMKLSAEGLADTGGMGIEVLEKDQRLGTSQFVEKARYHHALETELSRTISSMRNIDSARVHLALPKQSVFIRDRAKPSASVMIKALPGRPIEDNQVTAIIHLVASSVPYLSSEQVTVVDQWGRLLSSSGDKSGMGIANEQFDYTRKLEDNYAKRIEELLTPVLGHGRVRTKVSAELDFSVREESKEQFDPDKTQIRSESTQEQRSNGAIAAIGIPGALSNQPPGAGTTDKTNKNEKGGGKEPSNVSTQATRNYELDKTIIHSRKSQGTLQRLSIAVLVDDKISTNEAGETIRTPLTEEEIQTLTDIVKNSIGFNQARGDSVAVFNQSFQAPREIEPVAEPAFYEQPWVWSMAKQIIVGIAILLLVIMVARPAMKNLKSQTPAREDPKLTDNSKENTDTNLAPDQVSLTYTGNNPTNSQQDNLSQLPSPPEAYGDLINMARGLAQEDPKRVAKVIKTWVQENV